MTRPRPSWRPSAIPLAVAVGLVAGALAYAWMSPDAPPPPAPPPPVADAPPPPPLAQAGADAPPPHAPAPAPAHPAPAASAPAVRHIVRQRDPNGDPTPDLADYINDGERPTMGEVIDRLHRAGVYDGLGAFPPPGTRPPLIGLAVPDDFKLPPGYVRHYQATDDGQRIEPILMFSPDYQFFDAQHHPIKIPADRVVPPELAPPGLPIRRIVVPAPVAGPGPGS